MVDNITLPYNGEDIGQLSHEIFAVAPCRNVVKTNRALDAEGRAVLLVDDSAVLGSSAENS